MKSFVVQCYVVIIVKVSYAKGLNAAAMVLFTIQMLVHLFNYIVNSISVFSFFLNNWTCVCGYILLGAMFLKKRKATTDFILTIIGVLLWVSRFLKVFTENSGELLLSFIICSAGILGTVFVLIGLVFEIIAERQKDNSD